MPDPEKITLEETGHKRLGRYHDTVFLEREDGAREQWEVLRDPDFKGTRLTIGKDEFRLVRVLEP